MVVWVMFSGMYHFSALLRRVQFPPDFFSTLLVQSFILKKKWGLVSVYQDVGSGLSIDHPGLQELLHDTHQRIFDAIVLKDISRDHHKITTLLRKLEYLGVKVSVGTE